MENTSTLAKFAKEVQESMRVSPDKIMVGEERKPPFYPLSMAENSRDMAQELADKIQRRMEAGSPLLLLGDGNGLSSFLLRRGLVTHQSKAGLFPGNGEKSFWLKCTPGEKEPELGNNIVVHRSMVAFIFKSLQEVPPKRSLLVCINSRSAVDVIGDDLEMLMSKQRILHIEVVVTDYAAFMELPHDIQKIYLENCLSSDWHCTKHGEEFQSQRW